MQKNGLQRKDPILIRLVFRGELHCVTDRPTDRQTYVPLANTHYTAILGQEQCSAAQNDTKIPIGRRAICAGRSSG